MPRDADFHLKVGLMMLVNASGRTASKRRWKTKGKKKTNARGVQGASLNEQLALNL
jgi:hypothetical protein